MLARRNRLRTTRDIQRVSKQGRWAAGTNLTVRTQANRFKLVRCAVVISKKVDKRAVVRNRCRRRVQEILRLSLPSLEDGSDILIYIRKDISNLPAQEITVEIATAFQRLNLMSSGKKA